MWLILTVLCALACAPAHAWCGDGAVDGHEECDGAADGACPGACSAHCACPSLPPGDFELHVIDVGQGDALLIVSPDGFTTLVDAGKDNRDVVVDAYLASVGVAELDYTVVSHLDADHVGGMDGVLSLYPEVVASFDHGGSRTTGAYQQYDAAAGSRRTTVVPGSFIDMGPSMTAEVLHAHTGAVDDNDNSVVVRLQYGATRVLVGGDCMEDCEATLSPGTLDVYKVHHHGAADGSSQAFLDVTTPRTALISVGAGNSYGHPTQAALDRLASVGSDVHRTDLEGSLVVVSDGASYTVNGTCAPGLSCGAPAPPTVLLAQVAYDTPGTDSVEEFVDLYNATASPVDLGGWTLSDGAGSWTLPAGTTLLPDTFLSVARDAAGFAALHGFAPGVDGLSTSLNNGGDVVVLSNPAGAEIDRVAWEDYLPGWPLVAGSGSALVRTDPRSDTDRSDDWAVAPAAPLDGTVFCGPACASGGVVLAQVAYDTPGIDAVEEFVELYNGSAATVSLDGWTLADGAASWTLPAGTSLAPAAWLTVARDAAGFTALHGSAPSVSGLALSLNNGGDLIVLSDAMGAEVDRVAWEGYLPGWSLAAGPGEAVVRVDPAVDTDAPSDWTVAAAGPSGGCGACGGTVLIAQVAYDTPGVDAVEEFVDLFNPGPAAADVGGWTLADAAGSWTIPAGTAIAPDTYLTVARDAAGFAALYGAAPEVSGLTTSLNNTGDVLVLGDAAGAEVDRVAWEGHEPGWDLVAGTGASIARFDPYADTDAAADWIVVPAVPLGGTAGCGAACAGHVVIAAVAYDVVGSDAEREYFELHNPGSASVDLSGWYIADNISWQRVPAGASIGPQQSLIVARDPVGFLAWYGVSPSAGPFGLSLGNGADRLVLADAAQAVVDRVSWGGMDGWTLAAPTGMELRRIDPAVDTDTEADWAVVPALLGG